MLDPNPPRWRAAPRRTPRPSARRGLVLLGVSVLTTLGLLVAAAEPGIASPRGTTATPRNDGRHTWSTDGCSASPERGPGWDFHHACVHHDGCYRQHWASRSTCDSWFLRDMTASCAVTHRSPGAGRNLCRFFAAVYHQAVRRFGAGAYANGSSYIPLR
jgi:hypothetical protein